MLDLDISIKCIKIGFRLKKKKGLILILFHMLSLENYRVIEYQKNAKNFLHVFWFGLNATLILFAI